MLKIRESENTECSLWSYGPKPRSQFIKEQEGGSKVQMWEDQHTDSICTYMKWIVFPLNFCLFCFCFILSIVSGFFKDKDP